MNPEDANYKFQQAFNSGDIEAVLALYEPDATLVLDTGPVTGIEAIRQALLGFLAMKGLIQVEVDKVTRGGDDIAVLSSHWTIKGTGPDGQPIEMSGHSNEVVRRQPDGSWRFVVDFPFGAGT